MASGMSFSLMAMVFQIVSVAFWAFLIVSIVILVVNSQRNRRSLQNIEALLSEVKRDKDERHT